MSWKFPDDTLKPQEIITSEALNDGFMPASSEAQGRLNEHNLVQGVVAGTTWGASGDEYIPDTHVSASGFGLQYINTRGQNQTLAEGGTGATRGAWCVIDDVTGHNKTADKPRLDGAVQVDLSPAWNLVGGKEPPFQRPVAESVPRPMSVTFFAEEKMSVWIMATLQVQDASGLGQMFCLRVNGAVVTESITGSADLTNEKIDVQGWTADHPAPEILRMSPAAGAVGNEIGYPVCTECVIEIPPGDTKIEVMALNAITAKGQPLSSFSPTAKVAISSREIVILKLMR